HGVLHLLGYDHAEPAEEREMFTLQKRILADFRTARVDAARRAAQRDADERLLSAVGLDRNAEPPPADSGSAEDSGSAKDSSAKDSGDIAE
ncbi:MAG TPA: rRNA maturation RNase YbeY, partial [Pseudonocardiaceae bacterium]